MTLRLRLVLGYAYLVALVLVTAGSAIAGFVVLSRGIDRVLDDNVRSIEASMTMLESLERQDSATLSALLGATGATIELHGADEAFHTALDEAQGNITEDEEREVLGRLAAVHRDLVVARDRVVENVPERPLAVYEDEIFPRFQAVKAEVRNLLDVNHAAMQRADQEARASARRSGAWIALLVTVAVVSLVLLSRALQTRVLERLATVREVSKALAEGDTQRRVVLSGDDELSEIGARLNEILDRRDENQGRWRGRLAVEKRLALALFGRLDPEGTVFALDGTVLLEPPRDRDPLREDLRGHIGDWIRDEGSQAVEELASVDDPDDLVREIEVGDLGAGDEDGDREAVRLELLRTGPSRPVAWWWRKISE